MGLICHWELTSKSIATLDVFTVSLLCRSILTLMNTPIVRKLGALCGAMALAMLICSLPVRASATAAPAFPLKVSANGRYLVDQLDQPFRLNCEAPWLMSVQATDKDVDDYLDNRGSKGFNSIILMAMVHSGDYTVYAPQCPRNRFGRAPHEIVGDFSSRPDEKYWRFIDSIIDRAASRKMAVILAFTYLGYQGESQGWWKEINQACNTQEVCFNWGAWLGSRYRERTNIIWYTLGDFTPPAGSEGSRRTHKIVEGIKSRCPWALFGGEPSGSDRLSTDAQDFTDVLDMNSYYGYGPSCDQRVYLTADRAWRYRPAKPAWVGEPVYYGETITGMDTATGNRQDTRNLQWYSVLGGGTAGDSTSTRNVWTFTRWREDMDNGYAQDRACLFAFFESIPWFDLVPSGVESGNFARPLIASRNPTDRSYITAAATPSGSWLVAYVPPVPKGVAARTFSVDMSMMGGPTRARWFNPASGVYTAIGNGLSNAGTRSFTTPGDNGTGASDWVLVLTTAR